MRLALAHSLVCLCFFLSSPLLSAQDAWDESDTAIANHYIQSLQREPVYGKVLDLLWEHYEKHDQTRLLLEYFDKASEPEDAHIARLIDGHLQRKKGNSERALELYKSVAEKLPENLFVITALADVLEQEDRLEEAETYLAKLADILSPQSTEWVQRQLTRAEIARKRKEPEEAAAIWHRILEERPNDLELRQQIVALLLEEGRTEEAIASYQVLSEQEDVEMRMQALRELARLYEFIDDFENADQTYRAALQLVHFKHYISEELVGRLVNLHERFGSIETLEESWLQAAEESPRSEEANARLVQFYGLTASLVKQEEWLRKLVDLVPDNVAYRQQLAVLLVENDHFEEAAQQLEELVKASPTVPLSILKLQVRVALTLDGVPAAEKLLHSYLDKQAISKEILTQLLTFSQEHFLDEIVERILRDQLERGWAGEGENPELRLANFHHERGRIKQVKELLQAYLDGAPSPGAKAKRLVEVAHTYREMDLLEESREICQGAIESGHGNRTIYQILGETYVESFEVGKAVENFEEAWKRSETIAERIEIDQRIFNILRAKTGDRSPSWRGRRSPAVSPNILLPGLSEAMERDRNTDLFGFYAGLRSSAEEDPSEANRFRVAWWAVELQDFDEAYRHLPNLHNPENPTLEYEELLLKIAEQEERQGLILRQLELIAEIEPDREEEFLIRQAQSRLDLGFEDEAIRTLRTLVESPNASLRSVQALAKAYERQERYVALRDLWAEQYQKANILEKRQIIKPYAKTLVQLDLGDEALSIYADLIETETDIVQRRKLFEDQLTLASAHDLTEEWMPPCYEELARLYPLDRFYPEALSQIYLVTDRLEDAFVAMKRAYYMSDGDTELLERLGDLASQTQDLKSAIYYQRKLLSSDEEISPDSWMALIERLEKDMRIREADLTRTRLESKFAQDPDFLRDLARHYLECGELASARRILTKITALRPWDSGSLLEIGLLSLEIGDRERAKEIFEQILEQTAESAPLPGTPLLKAPIVSSNNERTPPGQSTKLGLEDYAESIEDCPMMPPKRADRLADWMREGKPEFQRVPPEVAEQRLRAIEELAKLKEKSHSWMAQWNDARTVPAQERLWALYHGGMMAEAQEILDTYLLPRTNRFGEDSARFQYALMTLRTGQLESLASWMEADSDRHQFVATAVFVLMRDDSHHFSDEALREVFSLLTVARSQAMELLNALNVDKRRPQALQLGEAIAQTQAIDDYLFFAMLAGYAEQLGLQEHWEMWSEEALAHLEVNQNLSHYFQSFMKTVEDNYHQQLSPEGQAAVLETIAEKIAQAPDHLVSQKLEASMWAALAVGRPEEAARHFDQLIDATETSVSTKLFANSPEYYEELPSQLWERLWRLLIVVSDRVPNRDALELFPKVAEAAPLALPRDESIEIEYNEFRLVRLKFLLELASPQERAQMIEEYRTGIEGLDAHIDLARGLEAWGFAAESVPVFRHLVELENDSRNVQAFLNACRQAQDYETALNLIDEYLSQRRFFPESMTSYELHKERANLLMLDGRLEELTLQAELQTSSEHRKLYDKERIRLLLEQGNHQDAIQILEQATDESGVLKRMDALQLVDLYLEDEQWDNARGLLDEMELTGSQVPDLQIITRLITLHRSQDPLDADALEEIARKLLEYRGSSELIQEVAIILAESDRPGVADGILSLKARSLQDPLARFDLLLEQANLRFTKEKIPVPTVESLVTLLHAWPKTENSGLRLLALLEASAEEHHELWKEAIDQTRPAPGPRMISRLAQMILEGDAVAKTIAQEVTAFAETCSATELRLAAHAFHDAGHSDLGWDILQRLHKRGEYHPRLDTDLVVPILAKLGRRDLLFTWHQWNLNFPVTPSQSAQLAMIYKEAGLKDLARNLFEKKHQSLRIFNSGQLYFFTEYGLFLIEEGDFHQAEALFKDLFHKSIGGDALLLVDLYGAWDRLEDLDAEIQKYHLQPSQTRQIQDAASVYPKHRPEIGEDGTATEFLSRF